MGYWGLIIDTGKFAIYCNIVHLSVLTKKDNSLFIDPHAETASISWGAGQAVVKGGGGGRGGGKELAAVWMVSNLLVVYFIVTKQALILASYAKFVFKLIRLWI